MKIKRKTKHVNTPTVEYCGRGFDSHRLHHLTKKVVMSKENDHFEEILKILYEEDLIGLANCGCPEDEYAAEAIKIAETLQHIPARFLLKNYINAIFMTHFEGVFRADLEKLDQTTERIWALKNPS